MKKFLAAAAIALAGCTPAVAVELAPPVSIVCHEDMECWDCETMGNKVCGEDNPLVTDTIRMFESRGLELPTIAYIFSDDCGDAHGWHRTMSDGTSEVEVCDGELSTMVHEVAHAWDNLNLTDAQRAELMERWGLKVWESYDEDAWGKQGAERLAIAFAYEFTGEGPMFFTGDRAAQEYQDVMEVIGR